MGWNNRYGYPEYVSVAERKERIEKATASFKKKNKGAVLQPVVVTGRQLVKTFWGKSWVENLESYRDYAYRLERGRSYVRHGAVIDLQTAPGVITALVSGTKTYTVRITIAPVNPIIWQNLIKECTGKINSLVELLQGKLADHVLALIAQPKKGLFPDPNEISFTCSCPDYATMCKHVSAVLYGIGIRCDTTPEEFFLLRGVNHQELLTHAMHNIPPAKSTISKSATKIADEDVSQIFGVEIAPPTTTTGKVTQAQVPAKDTAKTAAKTNFTSPMPSSEEQNLMNALTFEATITNNTVTIPQEYLAQLPSPQVRIVLLFAADKGTQEAKKQKQAKKATKK